MTAPRRHEPQHLDPDPRYVEPELEPVRRIRDQETVDEIQAGMRIVTLGCLLVAIAVLSIVAGVLMLTAPRGAPDDAASPTASALGLPGAPHVPPPPEDVAIAGPLWAGTATWYCSATSACTAGYGPSDLVAAIDSDLGIGKGERVTVRFGKHQVTVRIVDVCACGGERLIDLTSGAFRRLAPLEYGVLPVTLEVVGPAPDATLPNTDAVP